MNAIPKPGNPIGVGERVCPQCGQVLVEVGNFWICPQHGQVSLEEPFEALRIFLSYGHDRNEELVRCIKADLENRGHRVWYDRSEIKAGSDWRRAITEGILESQKVLSFLSTHSTRDPGVCLDEIAIAIGVRGGNIQTILVESEQDVRPPVSISHIQWLDMHEWQRYAQAGGAEWERWYQAKLDEIISVVESEESRRFSGEILTLEKLLVPISSDARIYQHLQKGLVGREWLVEAIEQWRKSNNQNHSRLFWIMGPPGSGKSAFAAHLAHYGKDKVIAVHFCEYDKPAHRDARRIVCTLAFQIATRLPDYRKLLLALPEMSKLDLKTPSELFDYLIVYPLRHVIEGGRERSLLVIDALDEAGTNGRNELVELLAHNAAGLPDWIGLIVSSRPESDVTIPLQSMNPFVLDTGSEANRADIRAYLRLELGGLLGDDPQADHLIEAILEKSEGVFLYAERVCSDLRQGYLSLERLDQFPQGLGGTYWQFFQRQFGDIDGYRREIRPALRAILAAVEPIPAALLQQLFDWQAEELRDFTRGLGSLFPQSRISGREVIQPFHKSVADWLTDEGRAGYYFVSQEEGHRMLVELGLRQLAGGPAAMDGYVLCNLPAHLAALERWEELARLLSQEEYVRTVQEHLGSSLYPLIQVYLETLLHLPPEQRNELWVASPVCVLLALKAVGSLIDRGGYDQASQLLESGEAILMARRQPEITSYWSNLAGRLAIYAGDREGAESRVALALETALEAGYQEGAAKALLGMAVIIRKFGGSRSDAQDAIYRALQMDFSSLDLDFQVRALLNLAMVYICRGQAAEAGECLDRAVDLVEKTGNPILRAWLFKYRGYLWLLKMDPTNAIESFQQASKLFTKQGHFQEAQRCEDLAYCVVVPSALEYVHARVNLAKESGLSDKLPPHLQTTLQRIQLSLASLDVVPNEAEAEEVARVSQELLYIIQELERIFDPNPLSSMISF